MKRFLCAVLAIIICVSFLTGCDILNRNKMCRHNWERAENLNEYTAVDKCSICGVTRKYTDSDSISPSDTETGFNMLRYNWDGYGVTNKKVNTCDLGYAIIDCLSKLQETGDVIPQISEDKISVFSGKLPVETGTVWIDCGIVGLFRLDPQMTEICKVETHLGEGKVLQITDTLTELLVQAWYYHPYDYWSGSYSNGTLTLNQLYKSDSAVEWVEIKSIHIENKIDSKHNKITLRVKAKDNKTVSAHLLSYQSPDNLGGWDDEEIELINGKESSVEFTFYGFYNYSYRVEITIDNTKIVLTINPKDEN